MSNNDGDDAPSRAERFVNEYEPLRAIYSDFSASVENLLKELLRQSGVEYHRLESRAKEPESLRGKILRPDKEGKYNALQDVTDLGGVRVVVFLREECASICKIIRDNFDIDDANSIDKIEDMDPDRFGYLSIHFVASYNRGRLALNEFKRYEGLKVEIQIRTILQHTWAVIDWRLRYKSVVEAPKSLRRSLFRMSALLETADEQFSVLMHEMEKLRTNYASEITKGNLELSIDSESLGIFLQNNDGLRKLAETASQVGYHVEDFKPTAGNPLVTLLLTLRAAGISRLEDLDSLIRSQTDNTKELLKGVFDHWQSEGKPPKIVIPAHSLIRLVVILNIPPARAEVILADYPFGAELQRATREVILGSPPHRA